MHCTKYLEGERNNVARFVLERRGGAISSPHTPATADDDFRGVETSKTMRSQECRFVDTDDDVTLALLRCDVSGSSRLSIASLSLSPPPPATPGENVFICFRRFAGGTVLEFEQLLGTRRSRLGRREGEPNINSSLLFHFIYSYRDNLVL
jgi:hypothetical protein